MQRSESRNTTVSNLQESQQRYDIPASQLEMDPFSNADTSATSALEEQKELDTELSQYESIDQGFFRNMITKLGRAELSHARWFVGREGEHKVCAFTDDEKHIMIVM